MWNPPCGSCWYCLHGEAHLCEHAADRSTRPHGSDADGTDLFPGLSTGAFAQETVLPAAATRLVPDGLSFSQAALLGCAVTTGVGAVWTTAGIRPGDSVVVIGLGGVGLSAVQGARLAGAGSIIAVDREAGKFDLARSLGATETLEAGPDVRKRVRALTGGRGADHALDCVGLAATIRDAYGMTRRGGRVTIVGIGGKDQKVEFSALELFHFARTITGCVAGSLDPDRDLPRLYEHAVDGTLDLASLISRETDLHGIDAAFDDMAAGRVARVLVRPNA
ncbi:zinc-binding dehydrogenase [Nonomuraea terrae]|uniref:zinc-binding dehydrogenase n=1 Tax=Nonomuraea terrae TaxID=2530383 RepID=UPI0037961486